MNSGSTMLGNLLVLGVYLLQSYAIYRVCLIRRLPNPFFAFIPFFQLYMLGMIGDSLKYQSRSIDQLFGRLPFSYALPLISIAGSILGYPLHLLTALLMALGELICYYLIFLCYARRNYLFYTVLACISPLMTILMIFSRVPFFGVFFQLISGILSIVGVIAPVAGPLLVLWCIRDRR